MDDITVRFIDRTPGDGISAPVLIEGLPGIGHVGKLVAEHLVRELGAEKIAEIASIFFPPQVIIDEQGTVRLANNEVYYYEGETHRLLFLVGDFQATSAEGHYLLADAYLDIAEACGVQRLYTLGGYGVGHLVEEPRVLGAVNQSSLRESVEAAGAIVSRDEPGGGIVGAAGLLLGLGLHRGIEGICLMGETSGYLVDPRSAASLLRVVSTLIGIEVDPTLLEQRAEEMEFMLQKLVDGDRISQDDELRYFV
ncbi:MAG TPA: proteasome assembly chaperone family protein [Methanoregulaceae archaeon]|nr:MAG: proteasome assembly chaperone family protein [Methanolinea sp.]HON80982.1 proteasome assembly chaperone family protein [Methanoregulaceae archaeon]HPD09711.1 proteasome assembly chaperone family protein [Methanoregulaceae archaeon]HRT14568.1 proteasome assembly chaperone family protein [Methanoregulaceae archaeon]HRU30139.1 proteasome assembly chaperone family protein [Methanoregulaceae archaeon]